jgi:chlorite dismutase
MKKNSATQPATKRSNATQTSATESTPSLSKINLDKFMGQLANVNVKEKKERQTIYVYPDGKSKDWINSEEGKKWRNKMRNTLRRHSDNILLYAKHSRLEDLKKEIDAFNAFYKGNFRINDYSLSSISSSSDEGKTQNYSLMLDIIKSSI